MEEWNISLAPMCGSWPWEKGLVHLIGILKNIAKQNFLSNFFFGMTFSRQYHYSASFSAYTA